jgi:hypothetical protein
MDIGRLLQAELLLNRSCFFLKGNSAIEKNICKITFCKHESEENGGKGAYRKTQGGT